MNWPIEWDHFTFRLQYKHSGTFANRKYDEQSYNQKSENVWPHSSNYWKCHPIIPGGGDSAYERGGDARRKFWVKPVKETDLAVAQAFFDP